MFKSHTLLPLKVVAATISSNGLIEDYHRKDSYLAVATSKEVFASEEVEVMLRSGSWDDWPSFAAAEQGFFAGFVTHSEPTVVKELLGKHYWQAWELLGWLLFAHLSLLPSLHPWTEINQQSFWVSPQFI